MHPQSARINRKWIANNFLTNFKRITSANFPSSSNDLITEREDCIRIIVELELALGFKISLIIAKNKENTLLYDLIDYFDVPVEQSRSILACIKIYTQLTHLITLELFFSHHIRHISEN